jgi:hypothetical protein
MRKFLLLAALPLACGYPYPHGVAQTGDPIPSDADAVVASAQEVCGSFDGSIVWAQGYGPDRQDPLYCNGYEPYHQVSGCTYPSTHGISIGVKWNHIAYVWEGHPIPAAADASETSLPHELCHAACRISCEGCQEMVQCAAAIVAGSKVSSR